MRLPSSVQEIADVIGSERALFLIGKLPKALQRKSWHQVILYVPKRLPLDHQLVKILGYQDAQKLADVFGGEILHPASCTGIYREFRDENILRLQADGVPLPMLAEWFDVSERHIKNLTREKPHEERRAANDNNARIPNRARA
jgi:hypothetical protein